MTVNYGGEVLYEGSEGTRYLNAIKLHHVSRKVHSSDSVAIEAGSGTGWQYSVVVTKLPEPVQGGQYVATVLSPWVAAYPFGDAWNKRADKVLERLVPDEWSAPEHVAAMTATLNYALDEIRSTVA